MVSLRARATPVGLAAFVALAACASGHAFLSYPNARGALTGCGGGYKYTPVAPNECRTNYCCQCGNAAFLQKRMAGQPWRLYSPMDRTLPIRDGFGMCGDGEDSMTAPNMKQGYFSGGCEGRAAMTGVKPGDVIDFQMQSTAHHQGFIELFLCDTTICGGDITRDCFARNQCVALEREPVNDCENGWSSDCAPIDPDYTTRWYMPCHKYPFEWEGTSQMVEDQTLGGPGGSMRYRIPSDFNCGTACVLQSYWATANTCAPPGYNEFFDRVYGEGKLGSWQGCDGDGKTIGGYSVNHKTCGIEGTFPEEFWNCADIHMAGERFNNHDYNSYYTPGNNGQKKHSEYSAAGSALAAAAPAAAAPKPAYEEKSMYAAAPKPASVYAISPRKPAAMQVVASDGSCSSCIESGGSDCPCSYPYDNAGQTWFVAGDTRTGQSGKKQFRICVNRGGANREMCWWCDDSGSSSPFRCDEY